MKTQKTMKAQKPMKVEDVEGGEAVLEKVRGRIQRKIETA
jgi:hypothetical protein